MLLNGPYPWHLKQRIKSRHGHLSNEEAAELLTEVMHPGLEGLFLAHLSEANNQPEIALEAHRRKLSATTVCSPRIFVGTSRAPVRFCCCDVRDRTFAIVQNLRTASCSKNQNERAYKIL